MRVQNTHPRAGNSILPFSLDTNILPISYANNSNYDKGITIGMSTYDRDKVRQVATLFNTNLSTFIRYILVHYMADVEIGAIDYSHSYSKTGKAHYGHTIRVRMSQELYNRVEEARRSYNSLIHMGTFCRMLINHYISTLDDKS